MSVWICGIAREDNKAPLYASITTTNAKTYIRRNILSPFDHLLSEFSPSWPKGKEINRRRPHFIEKFTLLETSKKARQSARAASTPNQTGVFRG